MQYCHLRNIVHLDLKPSNLLIAKNFVIKITNFGLARILETAESRKCEEPVVSRHYRAPEILLGAKICGFETDVWSIGCIFAEMVMNKPIFMGSQSVDIEQLILIFR